MMFKKAVYTLLLSLFLNYASANESDQSFLQEFSKHESILLKKLEETEPKKHYFLYMIAAEKLFAYDFYDLSEKYYLKAIEAPSDENKSKAFLRLINLSFKKNDMAELEKSLNKADSYFIQNPNYLNSDASQIINYYKMKLPSNSDKEFEANGKNGFSIAARDHNYRSLFRNGKYGEALNLLKRDKIVRSNSIDMQAEYDLLTLLVYGPQSGTKLTCEKIYDKYPESFSYGVITCRALTGFLQEKEISSQVMEELKQYFSKFDTDKSYLQKALKVLKNKS